MNNIKKNNDVFYHSAKGLRESNEDAHDIILNINGENKNIASINFFGIYDGHGSSHVSQYLKNNLSKFFLDKNVKYPLTKKYVTNVFNHIQKNVSEFEYSNYSGSTCTILILFKYNNDNYVNVINCGDSRCIINKNGFALPLTKDHKPNWPDELFRITNLGGNIVFDGADWRIKNLSVSRAIGDLDAKPYVDHIPDLYRYKIDKSDKFIVLSCDGLFESLKIEDIINFIIINSYELKSKKRHKNNNNISKKLIDYALKKGSTDNCSAIIIFLD